MRGAIPALLVWVVLAQQTDSTRVTYNTATTAVCPPGTYRRLPVAGNPGDKYEVCDTCDYGKYQDEFAQNECKQCGPGQYQDQSKRAASQVFIFSDNASLALL